MYLALQHGIFVANYPLVEETSRLPSCHARCRPPGTVFGMTTTPARLESASNERRPNSRYASLEQCTYEATEGRSDVP